MSISSDWDTDPGPHLPKKQLQALFTDPQYRRYIREVNIRRNRREYPGKFIGNLLMCLSYPVILLAVPDWMDLEFLIPATVLSLFATGGFFALFLYYVTRTSNMIDFAPNLEGRMWLGLPSRLFGALTLGALYTLFATIGKLFVTLDASIESDVIIYIYNGISILLAISACNRMARGLDSREGID